MPIHESDPWRLQYFERVSCPASVHVPTDDCLALELNPRFQWVYNKLLVAESQGLECGPVGALPRRYPVFKKPITNLKGMGIGSQVLRNEIEARNHLHPGDFWMTLLTGTHISTDCAVVNGEMMWCRNTRGIPGCDGTFDYWIIESRIRSSLEAYCREWIQRHLENYSGMVNLETIDGRIIEVHLRFADQWPDLYGRGWVEAVVKLYQERVWDFTSENDAKDTYSVVLFGPYGPAYRHPSEDAVARWRARPGVTSVQITFFDDLCQRSHAMPPGGFRLGIINCRHLSTGRRIRSAMWQEFVRHQTAEHRSEPGKVLRNVRSKHHRGRVSACPTLGTRAG